MTKHVTSDDVARHIGVSRSTVSRAFTPGAFVSPETRERVLAAARELGYHPNAIARALTSRKSNIVAVVIGTLVNPFSAGLLEHLTAHLQERGLVPFVVRLSPERSLDSVLPTLAQYQVGAVVITSVTVTHDMVTACAAFGLPVVFLNRVLYDSGAISICADLEHGGCLAAAHLLRQGYRRVALVQGRPGTWTAEARERGFRRGLAEQGLEPVAVAPGDYTYESGGRAAEILCGGAAAFDAVLCANDLSALGFLDALRRLRAPRLPAELGLVGIDDIPMAAWSAYELTSVHLPTRRMVEAAGATLSRLLDGAEALAETTLIPCRLVERQTRRRLA